MTNTLGMHLCQTIEDLSDEMSDGLHRNRLFLLFSHAELVFQASFAELHHNVLYESLLLILRVKEVCQLDHIWCTFQHGHYFIFS